MYVIVTACPLPKCGMTTDGSVGVAAGASAVALGEGGARSVDVACASLVGVRVDRTSPGGRGWQPRQRRMKMIWKMTVLLMSPVLLA
jgi:hypothetical protein